MLSGPDVGKPAICDIDIAICAAEVRTGRSNLAAAVPHRREFAIEVPEQKKEHLRRSTCCEGWRHRAKPCQVSYDLTPRVQWLRVVGAPPFIIAPN